MKHQVLLFMLAVASLLATSCASDDAALSPADGQRVPILLGSAVGETRAATNIQNASFEQMTIVDVQIEPSDSKDKTKYDLLQYQVTDAAGSLSPVKKVYPYYPVSGSNVNIYGIYPSGYLDAGSFTVQSVQLTKDAYKASDLIFGEVRDQASQKETVTIPFRHLLSKVVIHLEEGGNGEDVTGSIVKLLGIATKIDLTGRGVLADEADEASRTMIHLSNDGSKDCAAVIVPQTVQSGVLIEVSLKNNDVVNYKTSQSMTFESGKKYTFNITVVESELSVSTKVEDWIGTDDLEQTVKL